ncbi:hypothetical protein BJ508DRAFT_301068 [Ascobolus immersus RN42]|uniref:Uncharacterized protein n=1 Tax=Ascobolus immersus RN42 TaxID=1160509 RepID=A0A3N4IQ00_ASCIM|nr:hypothetical protein BJ508DRAFT_301068 [Ascobolus immersus RN42]
MSNDGVELNAYNCLILISYSDSEFPFVKRQPESLCSCKCSSHSRRPLLTDPILPPPPPGTVLTSGSAYLHGITFQDARFFPVRTLYGYILHIYKVVEDRISIAFAEQVEADANSDAENDNDADSGVGIQATPYIPDFVPDNFSEARRKFSAWGEKNGLASGQVEEKTRLKKRLVREDLIHMLAWVHWELTGVVLAIFFADKRLLKCPYFGEITRELCEGLEWSDKETKELTEMWLIGHLSNGDDTMEELVPESPNKVADEAGTGTRNTEVNEKTNTRESASSEEYSGNPDNMSSGANYEAINSVGEVPPSLFDLNEHDWVHVWEVSLSTLTNANKGIFLATQVLKK